MKSKEEKEQEKKDAKEIEDALNRFRKQINDEVR